MGIHNEPGTSKPPLASAKEMVATMLGKITDTKDEDRGFVPFKHDGKDEVVLLVNCLGSISELEMSGITNEAMAWLGAQKIKVRRVMAGTYMTSLNMPGFSLTLFLLPRSGDEYSSETILKYLDAPASAPGWKWYAASEPGVHSAQTEEVVVHKGKELDLARESVCAVLHPDEDLTKHSCRFQSVYPGHYSSMQISDRS